MTKRKRGRPEKFLKINEKQDKRRRGRPEKLFKIDDSPKNIARSLFGLPRLDSSAEESSKP